MMMCRRLMFVLLGATLLAARSVTAASHDEDARVLTLVHDWAPLVWLAPGERFFPLGVPEFMNNINADDKYFRTRSSIQSLLQNDSSFIYGRMPIGNVPIYALMKNCLASGIKTSVDKTTIREDTVVTKRPIVLTNDELASKPIDSNDVPGNFEISEQSLEPSSSSSIRDRRQSRPNQDERGSIEIPGQYGMREIKWKRLKPLARETKQPLHFHVTYWMFYPFNDGKSVCVLDLGFLGSWPIPTVAGVCFGRLKKYGSHVGDWEHVSLYFKGKEHPLAMYVSAHDAGAFYRYEPHSGTFVYESQETRKGIFQKPIFPERIYTSNGSHPMLFSARGSHGLWTAPGKHKFVRIPRLYDESGFGIPWYTWRKVELLSMQNRSRMPDWMAYKGRWGNPKSNCNPLARFGINFCEFVDGPTGIPMKKMNFRC